MNFDKKLYIKYGTNINHRLDTALCDKVCQ